MTCIHPRAVLLAVVLLFMLKTPADAQQTPDGHKQAISANPLGLLMLWFNGEYERIVGRSSTVGVGSSRLKGRPKYGPTADTTAFVNADIFYRYYPQARPLDGWAFGVRIGRMRLPSMSDAETYFGYGLDINRNWLLGERNNLYLGIGLGLKRLTGPEAALQSRGRHDRTACEYRRRVLDRRDRHWSFGCAARTQQITIRMIPTGVPAEPLNLFARQNEKADERCHSLYAMVGCRVRRQGSARFQPKEL